MPSPEAANANYYDEAVYDNADGEDTGANLRHIIC